MKRLYPLILIFISTHSFPQSLEEKFLQNQKKEEQKKGELIQFQDQALQVDCTNNTDKINDRKFYYFIFLNDKTGNKYVIEQRDLNAINTSGGPIEANSMKNIAKYNSSNPNIYDKNFNNNFGCFAKNTSNYPDRICSELRNLTPSFEVEKNIVKWDVTAVAAMREKSAYELNLTTKTLYRESQLQGIEKFQCKIGNNTKILN